ncbi:hypothetical protein CcaverHIS002_0609190 [Cutaneotrichosporon cavernicola]|nr:hypothetical protein CcaverHIS002_0609190 [Cutaneotrichosporon cavernicola]BEJ02183.1 hypothetical protein CcaverHIS631_0608650 [Cutaneotrichosporon cavernicola]BEJ09944.1 hypothetical protein CcaverHIS641_0608590 [Cutaneotrichosporon cavernicola]
MSIPAIGLGRPPQPDSPPPINGRDYLAKLHKYLSLNIARLAPPLKPKNQDATWLQQSYTLLTLGLDPNSAPLSRALKVPLTLGFGAPAPPQPRHAKPVLLRLPPDKILYLLLRWQSLPQSLPHVGRTDVPVPDAVPGTVKGARVGRYGDGDVESVRSWVGSIRTVSSRVPSGWWGPPGIDEDKLLLELYAVFNALPGLLIHPPFNTDAPIAELMDAGGYTLFGGVDVRVPLDVMRNLQVLELDGFDPRAVLVPPNPLLHSLTVHDVEDADDWIVELLVDGPQQQDDYGLSVPPLDTPAESPLSEPNSLLERSPEPQTPRFPNLRHLSIHHAGLLALPSLPLTSVTHLDLSGNLLNEIPDLSGLHNLVSLSLAYNVITSVRRAPQSIGNVTTLNLAHNRIDCLVGLERVLGLKRVDVRANELPETSEVGRLAVLPQIEGVWATGNSFATPESDWRVEVSAFFAGEGRDIVLDGTPLTWAEGRRVDAALAARGKRRPPPRPTTSAPATAPASAANTAPSSPRLTIEVNTNAAGFAGRLAPSSSARAAARSPVGSTETQPTPGTSSPLPTSRSPTKSPSPEDPFTRTPVRKAKKKRAKRRVVNLDDEGSNRQD